MISNILDLRLRSEEVDYRMNWCNRDILYFLFDCLYRLFRPDCLLGATLLHSSSVSLPESLRYHYCLFKIPPISKARGYSLARALEDMLVSLIILITFLSLLRSRARSYSWSDPYRISLGEEMAFGWGTLSLVWDRIRRIRRQMLSAALIALCSSALD